MLDKHEFELLSAEMPRAWSKLKECDELVNTYPNSSIGAARAFTELLLREIAISRSPERNVEGRLEILINRLKNTGHIPAKYANKFHLIRTTANPIIHGSVDATIEKAETILETALELGRWFESTLKLERSASRRQRAPETAARWDWFATTDSQKKLFSRAALGEVAAIYELGVMDETNNDVPSAVRWYLMATEMHYAQARFRLAYLCAKAGYYAAMTVLGDAYLTGVDVERDLESAWNWYLAAAQHGSVDALYNLGNLRENASLYGDQLPTDDRSAADWYLEAAEYGHEDAMYKLGKSHDEWYQGDYFGDMVAAIRWYLSAAQSGSADAMFRLSEMYHKGQCLPQNDVEALEWCTRADHFGHPLAEDYISEIRARS